VNQRGRFIFARKRKEFVSIVRNFAGPGRVELLIKKKKIQDRRPGGGKVRGGSGKHKGDRLKRPDRYPRACAVISNL